MTNKAYIVANEEQEREVLEKLESEGLVWTVGDIKPTEFRPSKGHVGLFPYVLINRGDVCWGSLNKFDNDATVIYDGRKEEQMSDKYVVSQDFMNELEEWKLNTVDGVFISDDDIEDLPYIIVSWWVEDPSDEESNNRLIAIIRWVNGEDVFEVEKPKKWIVRSKETDDDNDHWYVRLPNNIDGINDVVYYMSSATLFDTKEEAQSWANSHQEVIEVN